MSSGNRKNWWRSESKRGRAKRSASRASSTRRLWLETLEDRLLLSGLPELLKDLNLNTDASFPNSIVQLGAFAYFGANDGVNGTELWRSDGTAAGTTLVKDIRPGIASSGPGSLTIVNGTLFFGADDGANGRELWTSDGTATGTTLVKDINPGGTSPTSAIRCRNRC